MDKEVATPTKRDIKEQDFPARFKMRYKKREQTR
jgi:hypothetical protein